MVKTLNSKISDPRPRINVTLQSDDEKTEAQISKGYVNIQRGHKKAILRVPYGELSGIIELAEAAKGVLEENGYKSDEGSDIPANSEPEDATDSAVQAPGNAEDAGVQSVVTSGEQQVEADTATEHVEAVPEKTDEERAAAVDARNEQQAQQGNPFA